MDYSVWNWILLGFAALITGLSKTGIPGLGILSVGLFAVALGAIPSVGVVLPLLICGDLVAVLSYHHHASWKHLWRMFPWAAAGVLLGVAGLKWMRLEPEVAKQEALLKHVIGALLVVLVVLHVWHRYGRRPAATPNGAAPADNGGPIAGGVHAHVVLIACTGILAGFTTMIANAAGPIMILYLLAMRLPKMEFIGTSAWFFASVNLFKVPFSIWLGLMTPETSMLTAKLAAFVILGALAGRVVLKHLNQTVFEVLALLLTCAAAGKLLW